MAFIRAYPRGRCVQSGWLGPFVCALGVVGFIWGLPWRSLGSFGPILVVVRSFWFVGFIRARRASHSGSLGSVIGVPATVGFIWVRQVHLGAPWVSLGSFWRALRSTGSYEFVGFIRAHSGGPRVYSRVSCGWSSSFEFVGYHSGALWESLGSLGFILACPMGARVHSWFVGFLLAGPWGRQDHSGSLR